MTKSPFERLLTEATCEDTHVTPLHLFKQISIACYEFEFYNMTRNHIWSNIKDKTPNVRRLNKTLNLIEYLIINSTEELVNEFKEEIYYINMLKEYKTTENYPDIVILVKEKAKFIVDLLENGEKLQKERQEAFKLAERIAGVSSNKPKAEEKPIKNPTENNINENKNVKKMDFQDFSSFGCDKNNNNNNEWIDWTTDKKKSNEFNQKIPSNSFEEVQKATSSREKGFSFSVSNPNLKQAETNFKNNKGKFEDSFNISPIQNIQKKEISSQVLKKAQTMGEKNTQKFEKDLLSFDEPAIPENTQNKTNNLWETNEIWGSTTNNANNNFPNFPANSNSNWDWSFPAKNPENKQENGVFPIKNDNISLQNNPFSSKETKEIPHKNKQFADIETNLIDLQSLKADEKTLKAEKSIEKANNTTNLLLTKPEDWDNFFKN